MIDSLSLQPHYQRSETKMFSIQPYQNRDEIEGINVCVCGACQDNARGYASRSHVCEHGCDAFLIAQSLHDCVDGLLREHVHAHAERIKGTDLFIGTEK